MRGKDRKECFATATVNTNFGRSVSLRGQGWEEREIGDGCTGDLGCVDGDLVLPTCRVVTPTGRGHSPYTSYVFILTGFPLPENFSRAYVKNVLKQNAFRGLPSPHPVIQSGCHQESPAYF